MRRALWLTTALLVPAWGLALDSVERFQLANGLTVIVGVERRLPLVNVTCIYRVGSANERPGITGIAHYVEHMAFRATENISHADVTGTVERIGGRWNGYTWIDQTMYAATVPSWALESILRIESERMSRVLFDRDAFERERTSVVAELQGYENDPASILRDLAVATSFEIHPYRYNVIGWLTDVLRITHQETFDFYRDYYGPNHAYLSIVGDVEPGEVRALVERYFSSLAPSRRSAEVRVTEPPQRGEKVVTLRYPGTVSDLLYVYRAPKATSPDFPKLLLLDAVLAGGRGLLFGGREAATGTPLARAVEDAGGFGASTSLTASRAPFVYEISASATEPASLAALERLDAALDAALARVASEGPTEDELDTARRLLRAEAAYENETLADIGHRLSYYEALGSEARAQEILDALDGIGPEEVKAFAHRYLSKDRRTLARHLPGAVEGAEPPDVPRATSTGAAEEQGSPVPDRALEPLEALPIERTSSTLPNGVAIAAARRAGQTACLSIRLGFGSRLDPPGKEGLALLVARLIAAEPELTSLANGLGARKSSSALDAPAALTNGEFFDLEILYLPGDGSEPGDEAALFGALGRALSRRDWTEEEIAKAREDLLDERASLISSPSRAAEASALAGIGRRLDPTGSEESLRSLSRQDVTRFAERALVGSAVTVAIVSPHSAAESLAALGLALGSIPAADKATHATAPPGSAGSGEERITMAGKTQAEIAAALPAVARDDADALPLRLLAYIIGETGYAGRLGDRLVDSGLTYSVYTESTFGDDRGVLLVTTAAAPSNVDAVLATIREVLGDLAADGVTEAEYRECRAFRLGRLVLGLDSPSRTARSLLDSLAYGRDELDFPARSREILAVSRERLDEVARRYLSPERLAVAVTGAVR